MSKTNWFCSINVPDLPKKIKKSNKDNIQIISYNVNNWKNYDETITDESNYTDIKNMLLKYDDIDIIVLYEITITNKITMADIISTFNKNGYTSYVYCHNGCVKGNRVPTSWMLVLSKHTIKIAEYINLTVGEYIQNGMHIRINDFDFICICLKLEEINNKPVKEVEYNNQLKRTWQLQRILDSFKKIDVIVGDFNFSIGDPEFKFITEQKKFTWDGITDNTSLHNRTDFAFTNSKSEYNNIKSTVLQCDYSNHLPVVYEFSKD